MSIPMHTISVPDGANGFARADRIIMGLIAVPYGSASAGSASTAAVTVGDLPVGYSVFIGAGQDTTAWVTSQTSLGFTLNVSRRLAADALAAGTMHVLLVA